MTDIVENDDFPAQNVDDGYAGVKILKYVLIYIVLYVCACVFWYWAAVVFSGVMFSCLIPFLTCTPSEIDQENEDVIRQCQMMRLVAILYIGFMMLMLYITFPY